MSEKVTQGMALVDDMTPEELDSLVDYIRVVFKSKRQQNAARSFAALAVGDRVQFHGNLRPQYLIGLTGEVVEKRNSRILVALDRGPTKKFATGRVLAQPSSLKKLED